jgi:hypothetical protein
MKATAISQLKQEMKNRSSNELLDICLRLARFKKENKELLTYLLFEVHDEQTYIKSIKTETDRQFHEINKSNIYFAKKSIRKILRTTNKFIRFSGLKHTEVELLLHFCKRLKDSGIPMNESIALTNIYIGQIQKIKKSLRTLHEDLQYDYGMELKSLLGDSV